MFAAHEAVHPGEVQRREYGGVSWFEFEQGKWVLLDSPWSEPAAMEWQARHVWISPGGTPGVVRLQLVGDRHTQDVLTHNCDDARRVGYSRLSSGKFRPLKHCRPGHRKQFLARCSVSGLNRHALHHRHIKFAQCGGIRARRKFSVFDAPFDLGSDARFSLHSATSECSLQVSGFRRAVYSFCTDEPKQPPDQIAIR